ncbi:MAG: sensor histidine kinase [Sulfuricella sp.]|nr:sensor histidine kinase [Sulfuricella sp.]
MALFFSGACRGEAGHWSLGVDAPLSALEDRDGKLSVEQVAALPDSAFRSLSGGLSAGYGSATYWLKTVPPQVPAGGELLLEIGPSYLDDIVLYEYDGSAWHSKVTGDLQPYAGRDVGYRQFVLRVAHPEAGTPLFLRVRSSSVITLRGAFWAPVGFAAMVVPESLLAGAFFGVAGLSVLLALFYGLWLRSRVFLVYGLTLTLAMGLVAALNGFHAQLVFRDFPLLANYSVSVFVILTQACSLWLVAELLETRRHFPRFDRVLRRAALVGAILVATVFGAYYRYAALTVLLGSWLLMASSAVAALRLVRKRANGMRIILAAVTIHVIALVPNMLMILAVISPGFWSMYGWQAEILVHMLLLHSAMLWRLRKNEEDQRSLLGEALNASWEAERKLDARVAERTSDLNEARHRLEFALASERRLQLEQRQFMSMVSHEFRTPLAIINSVSINLAEFPPLSREEMTEHSEQILRATRRLARLVDNCLTDERLDQAAFTPQLEAVSPSELAREAAEIVEWSPRHRLQLDLDELPPAIVCDPTLVRIAISNLLDNAIKYSESGTISLSGSADAYAVKFVVTDQGPGLRGEDAERIFERFTRGENKKVAGAGLGLYVVRRIARLHGGDVSARNGREGGAAFEFEIRRGEAG